MLGPKDAKVREIEQVVFSRSLDRGKLLRLGEFDRVEAVDGYVLAQNGR